MAKHYQLQRPDRVFGWTDLFVVNRTELTETTDNTAQAIVLDVLKKGDVVAQNALIEIGTVFAGPSDLTATCSVGVTSALTTFTPAATICTAGAGATVATGDTSDCQTNSHYIAAADINLLANFIPDADSALDEFTAGELRIWLTISRYADRSAVTD
jgi:hypothetical protein